MQYLKNNKIITGVIAVLLIGGGVFWYQSSASSNANAQRGESASTTPESVEILDPADTSGGSTVNASGEIRARLNATLSAQTSGVIQRVPVQIGDTVAEGGVIAEFENANQRASVRQARAGLSSAEAQLAEIRAGARPGELANSELSVEQAETALADARESLEDTRDQQAQQVQDAEETLLNTNLQAYLQGDGTGVQRGSLMQPTISGTYESNERGEYVIELYRSGANSGYSFRYSGLENGVGTVSTQSPQRLGGRGLFIQFPDDFAGARTVEWVVPIPNMRSSQFTQARNALESAREGRDTAIRQAETAVENARQSLAQARNNNELTQAGARSERIQAQEGQVESARASVDQAQARLADTIVRAPFSGTILSVSAQSGEYTSTGQPVAKIVDENSLEIRVFVSETSARNIAVGDAVTINDEYSGRVAAVAPAVDQDTGNIEIRIEAGEEATQNLTSGSFADVTFQTNTETDADPRVPLAAVGTGADGSYVFVINDAGELEEFSVTTGEIVGDAITIESELPDQPIVSDVSGLYAGQSVAVNESENE